MKTTPSPESQNHAKERRSITHIYMALILSIVLQFVPVLAVQLFGAVLLLVVMAAAYVVRGPKDRDSLSTNHMTYLIGTIWIGSLFLSIGMGIATAWFLEAGNHTLFHQMIDGMMEGAVIPEDMIEARFIDYLKDNMALLVKIGLATVMPSLIYIAYRIWKGLSRAVKGYRIARPKSWF